MKKSVYTYKNQTLELFRGDGTQDADLVIVFGPVDVLENASTFESLKTAFPDAEICGASCGSSILYDRLVSDQCTILAVKFLKSHVKLASVKIHERNDIQGHVQSIQNDIPQDGLKGLSILVDGFAVNSGFLVQALTESYPDVPIYGGLASDGDAMQTSCVMGNAPAEKGAIIAIGFYGDDLHVSTSLAGGWQRFGPERVISKSHDNILEEIDGKNAVELYKQHLQKDDLQLPKDGLMLPLAVFPDGHPELGMTRSVIGVTEDGQGLVFAGDVPQGHHARFMTSSIQSLCTSAEEAVSELNTHEDGVALAFSCIGHHMFLCSMTEDELEVLTEQLGDTTPLIGFYSNGEISPIAGKYKNALHNQTTALVLISEA